MWNLASGGGGEERTLRVRATKGNTRLVLEEIRCCWSPHGAAGRRKVSAANVAQATGRTFFLESARPWRAGWLQGEEEGPGEQRRAEEEGFGGVGAEHHAVAV